MHCVSAGKNKTKTTQDGRFSTSEGRYKECSFYTLELLYWNEGKQFLIDTRVNMLYKNFTYFGVVLDSSERGSNDEPSIKKQKLTKPN